MSLRQKRSYNVLYEEASSDEFQDSDYELPNKLSTNQMRNRRNDPSVLNKQFQQNSPVIESSDGDFSSLNNSGRRPKCFSKNALMARENRIKKKLYVQNLENSVEKYRSENRKLTSIMDSQSVVIRDLKKEIKYLKNVLANSTDISRLLKCINQNTGMPVSTSLNNRLRVEETVSHPWAESPESLEDSGKFRSDLEDGSVFELGLKNGEFSACALTDFERDSNWNDLFSDLRFPNWPELPVDFAPEAPHIEHNYNQPEEKEAEERNEVGVCLHISQHKVSLEFCASCAENAAVAWGED